VARNVNALIKMCLDWTLLLRFFSARCIFSIYYETMKMYFFFFLLFVHYKTHQRLKCVCVRGDNSKDICLFSFSSAAN